MSSSAASPDSAMSPREPGKRTVRRSPRARRESESSRRRGSAPCPPLGRATEASSHAVEPCRPPSGSVASWPSRACGWPQSLQSTLFARTVRRPSAPARAARSEKPWTRAPRRRARRPPLPVGPDREPHGGRRRREGRGHAAREPEERVYPADHDEAVPERAALEEPLGQAERGLFPEATDRKRRLAGQRQWNGIGVDPPYSVSGAVASTPSTTTNSGRAPATATA